MTYFKYRSLNTTKQQRWFEDILKTQELHASKFVDLNDPMEGYFRCQHIDAPSVLEMKLQRENALICSLSKSYDIGLMWSHYADEHKGCCIEVEVVDDLYKSFEVDYKNLPVRITEQTSLDEIFRVKSPQWQNEAEVRFMQSSEARNTVKVKIHNIYFGMSMDVDTVEKFTEIVKKHCPELTPIQLTLDMIDFGYDKDGLNLV